MLPQRVAYGLYRIARVGLCFVCSCVVGVFCAQPPRPCEVAGVGDRHGCLCSAGTVCVPELCLVFRVQDVVNTHPGLAFLKEASEFHSRYITTVSIRAWPLPPGPRFQAPHTCERGFRASGCGPSESQFFRPRIRCGRCLLRGAEQGPVTGTCPVLRHKAQQARGEPGGCCHVSDLSTRDGTSQTSVCSPSLGVGAAQPGRTS